MFGYKSSLPQALRRSPIIACSNSSVEELVNRLCHWSSNLNQLESWQLRLNIGHCWPACKNGPLYTSQNYDQCTGSSRSDYRYDCASPRSFGVNCDRSRLVFHIQILFLTVLLLKNQKKLFTAFYPLTDGQTKRQNSMMKAYLRVFVNCE